MEAMWFGHTSCPALGPILGVDHHRDVLDEAVFLLAEDVGEVGSLLSTAVQCPWLYRSPSWWRRTSSRRCCGGASPPRCSGWPAPVSPPPTSTRSTRATVVELIEGSRLH